MNPATNKNPAETQLSYGVIPARKNSKGLPGKNKALLNGKPLIYYTCVEALKSNLDQIFLSTDDKEIIEYVQDQFPKINVPYVRPDSLSTDKSQAIDVALHFLEWLKEENQVIPHSICWLQPTSPLRTFEDINTCLNMLQNNTSVISVVKVNGMNPYKMKVLKNGFLNDAFPNNHGSTNRQDLPTFYICNGAIFLAKTSLLLEQKVFYGEKSFPYEMEEIRSVNIDSEIDLLVTKAILERIHGTN